MATTSYFEKHVTDAATEKEIHLEISRTNYAGEGPQIYLNLGGASVILSHEDAKAFCAAVDEVAGYFRHWQG